jgi:hypothetical protein
MKEREEEKDPEEKGRTDSGLFVELWLIIWAVCANIYGGIGCFLKEKTGFSDTKLINKYSFLRRAYLWK